MRVTLACLLTMICLCPLFLGACAPPTCGDADWQDITWKLQSYGAPAALKNVIGSVTLTFVSKEKAVNGSGGCNHYFGDYTISRDCVLTITQLGSTEMACLAEGVMAQEQTYYNLLQDAGKIEVKDGELRITCGDGLLVFIR